MLAFAGGDMCFCVLCLCWPTHRASAAVAPGGAARTRARTGITAVDPHAVSQDQTRLVPSIFYDKNSERTVRCRLDAAPSDSAGHEECLGGGGGR